MASELAPVTPAVLKWARESVGATRDEAAQRASVSVERLDEWERGHSRPTIPKLRELAALYQRPLAVFLLPEPPTDYQAMHDFRRHPDHVDLPWSRTLHKVFRRALDQRAVAEELLEVEGEMPTPELPVLRLSDDPESAGRIARNALGVTLDVQMAWAAQGHPKAIDGWIAAVEQVGVMVLRTSDVSFSEMRGFSISDSALPIIVINNQDWPNGQFFTLAHEFTHILLRLSGLCDLVEPDAPADRRVEVFCNAVAATMLMPADALLQNPVIAKPGERTWDDEILAVIGRRYGVSREAALRRLVTLGRASMSFYLERRDEYMVAYAQLREENKAKRKEKDGGGGELQHRKALRERGQPYVKLVLEAYHRRLITASSMSDALGLKLKHIPALEREATR